MAVFRPFLSNFSSVVKLDGRMSPTARAAVIDAFNTKPEITVFLISLKVGWVGYFFNKTARAFVLIFRFSLRCVRLVVWL